MEFWNDEITEKSWEKLIELKGESEFVLIGGWAVYLYTKLHKSKDIDIVIDYNQLRKLSQKYVLNKNERLKKYEIKLEGFDIDVYLPNYSILTLPVKDIMGKQKTSIEGFDLPKPEALLLLKLGACIERRESIKGSKDAIDILGLLFHAGIDLRQFKDMANEYKLTNYPRTLLSILQEFNLDLVGYLNLNQKSFSVMKKKYVSKVREMV